LRQSRAKEETQDCCNDSADGEAKTPRFIIASERIRCRSWQLSLNRMPSDLIRATRLG